MRTKIGKSIKIRYFDSKKLKFDPNNHILIPLSSFFYLHFDQTDGTWPIWSHYPIDPNIRDPIKRSLLYFNKQKNETEGIPCGGAATGVLLVETDAAAFFTISTFCVFRWCCATCVGMSELFLISFLTSVSYFFSIASMSSSSALLDFDVIVWAGAEMTALEGLKKIEIMKFSMFYKCLLHILTCNVLFKFKMKSLKTIT